MKLRSSIALVAILAVGCGDGNGPRVRVYLAPASSQFQLVTTPSGSWATIPYTLRNDGDRSIFVGGCGAFAERLVNGQWEQDHPVICALASSSIDRIDPGQSVDWEATAEHAGTFRLRAAFTVDAAETTTGSVVSDTFEVK